ncbi:hypothetical protein BsIDN1_14060 [Bacillus safensis]|uniref:Uncharacterized protein n=1 Tax=Bacillus safensis TaxID=561879 RepID=A0A5S9M4S1_BACIA|nr:hypothetical protein BsIDN1_14060 [Bacillus safensis]
MKKLSAAQSPSNFKKKEIDQATAHQLLKLSYIALLVLLPGIFGAIFLTKSIRKDTLGLEPHEIASLYRERERRCCSL